MATWNPESVTRLGDGLLPTYRGISSTTEDFFIPNDGKVYLHFRKTSTGDSDITFNTYSTVDGLAVADHEIEVSANSERFVGPFPTTIYNNENGRMKFSVSGSILNLVAAALQLP